MRGSRQEPARRGRQPDRAGRTPARSGPHRLSLAVQYGVAATTLPSPATLRRWVRAAQERDVAVLLRFVATREASTLNATFRGKEYATNVLTFVYDDVVPLAGDLVLCAPVLRREAKMQGKTLADHCAHLVVHGMLHLQGYDHDSDRAARVMETRESKILAGLGIGDPYAERPAARKRRALDDDCVPAAKSRRG
jgi:probable rRNA maturation factor